jgi:hypothetical protein
MRELGLGMTVRKEMYERLRMTMEKEMFKRGDDW